jgi:hypothetical protein
MDDTTERYAEDLATIRRMVAEREDLPLLEYWAFVVWGVLILLGTLVHWIAHTQAAMEPYRLALTLWIPIVALGAIQELVAFVRRLNADEVPLATRKITRLMLQAGGVFIVLFAVLVHELSEGIHPGVIMLLGALAMLPYGSATYAPLFIEAFALIGIGLGVLVLAPATTGMFVLAGVAVALTYLASGIHHRILERSRLG